MIKCIVTVLISFIFALNAFAQAPLSDQLDAAARAAKTGSVMFAPQNQEDEAREAYEEEMRARAAYEEEMRAREEAYRRAEEERLRALKPVNLFGNTLKIYAIINGEVLTSRDMQDRVNSFVATTQIPITKQNKELIMDKVLQTAIDEKIKLQEAKKNNVLISSAELKEGMENFAKSNGVTLDEFSNMLTAAHVNQKVFLSQMKAEMAWARLVQKKAAQSLRISQGEIKKTIENITKNNQKQKFMISELVISKKNGKHIEELVSNLRQDPRFELYAMQFSESPTAKNGGRLGWVSSEQLPDKLATALKNMKENDVSGPIGVGNDYYILKLEKKYTPGVDKLPTPSEAEVRQLLQGKKMEEISNKYLKDLRAKAIVERKA